jgi:hypothetical protein
MLGPDVVEPFQEAFGVSIFAGYAPPESAILVANMPLEGMRQASIGRPLPGHEVIVIDADGREQPLGVEGEIALWGRPASLFSGYWEAPDATDAVFRGEWSLTGDRGTRADGGYLWLSVVADDAAPEAASDPPVLGAPTIGLRHPAATDAVPEVDQEAAVARAPEAQPTNSTATALTANVEQPPAERAPTPATRPTIPARPRLVAAPRPEDARTADDAGRGLLRRSPPTTAADDDDAETGADEDTLNDALVARVRAYGHAEPR